MLVFTMPHWSGLYYIVTQVKWQRFKNMCTIFSLLFFHYETLNIIERVLIWYLIFGCWKYDFQYHLSIRLLFQYLYNIWFGIGYNKCMNSKDLQKLCSLNSIGYHLLQRLLRLIQLKVTNGNPGVFILRFNHIYIHFKP